MRECNNLLPVQYHVEDTWIQFTPMPIIAAAPEELKPATRLTWKYLTPKSLATSGIYTQEDLDTLRNHIMFPAEKTAVLHTIAKGFTGQSYSSDSISVANLLDDEAFERIYTSTATRIWNGFVTFGSATAGFFGIFVTIRIAKMVFDTLIHGYALHSAYGCSIQLLGAIWDSLTNLLLHMARGKQSKGQTNQPTETTREETPIVNVQPEGSTTKTLATTSAVPIVYSFSELNKKLNDQSQA